MFDKILERFGLKYDDLIEEEKLTLTNWVETLEGKNLTIEKVREYVHSMRQAVDSALASHEVSGKHDTFLKARLKNYILLEAMLEAPDKARKALEEQLASIKRRKA